MKGRNADAAAAGFGVGVDAVALLQGKDLGLQQPDDCPRLSQL